MKYLKFGFESILKRVGFNILIIVEIALLLLVTNIMIANCNNKSFLYEPYREILSCKGYDETFDIAWKGDFVTLNEKVQQFKGDVSLYTFGIVSSSEIAEIGYTLNDNIFLKMNLPLKKGSWPSKVTDENGNYNIIVSPNSEHNVGDIIQNKYGTFKVAGILTDITYYPQYLNSYSDTLDLNAYYEKVDYRNCDDSMDTYAIIPESVFPNLLESNVLTFRYLICYNTPPTKEEDTYNKNIIEELGGSGYTFEEERLSIEKSINKLYRDITPIVLCVSAIVLFGLIGLLAINIKSQIHDYAIYFICGCRWKDCIKISFMNVLIIIFVSMILFGILMNILNIFGLSATIGLSFAINNVYITLFILIAIIIISLIAPLFIIKNTSPVETIKENET